MVFQKSSNIKFSVRLSTVWATLTSYKRIWRHFKNIIAFKMNHLYFFMSAFILVKDLIIFVQFFFFFNIMSRIYFWPFTTKRVSFPTMKVVRFCFLLISTFVILNYLRFFIHLILINTNIIFITLFFNSSFKLVLRYSHLIIITIWTPTTLKKIILPRFPFVTTSFVFY